MRPGPRCDIGGTSGSRGEGVRRDGSRRQPADSRRCHVPRHPKALRAHLGLTAGEVDVVPDGVGLRVGAVARSDLVERQGRLVIPPTGGSVGDDDIRTLRDADQR